MTQSTPPESLDTVEENLPVEGGAAILAPVTAFQGGIPPGAMILLPLRKPNDELFRQVQSGPVALRVEQMWELLGFNGPAVQIQDAQGRPIMVGLEDLLASLEKHYQEKSDDLNRGRLFAQELLKFGKHEKAEKVLAQIVASGGGGADWLGLGIAQSALSKWDKAESTLKGAINLLPGNAFPSLHLARLYQQTQRLDLERQLSERAIAADPNCVEAWAFLFMRAREVDGDAAAEARLEQLAQQEPNNKTAAPYVAVQGVYNNQESTRDKAIDWAQKAVTRNPDDVLALLSLSALYGQKRDFKSVIDLLSRHETKMVRDVRLANNYFEALFQSREMEKVTRLLNALAGSQNQQVKQYAVERSRMVAQYLQQQQQALQSVARGSATSQQARRPG
jgi:tetratricopeptide (TPR) repeat protein